MKIAYLTQSYPPMISGAAIIAQRLAEQMAGRGHQVLVLAASDCPSPYLIQNENLIVNRLASVKNPFRVGQRFAIWPHQAILKSLRDFSPDIIHSHDPFQFALSGLLYARRRGVPLVLSIHQLPRFFKTYLPRFPLLNQIIIDKGLWAYCRWLARHVDALVAPTHTIANEVLVETGYAPQVIGYGIDPAFFESENISPEKDSQLRSELGIPTRVPILLHVGRLDLDKQVDVLIRAAAAAMRDHPAHLLIVGDGTEKDRLARLCEAMGIGERSHLPGYITVSGGLPDLYRMASVFITASEIETQGLVLQEAQACGLPVVAFSATCIPEVVYDGIHGWLARPGDASGLAACLRGLLADPGRARAMGQAGRKFVKKFDIENMGNAYEEFYSQASLQLKSLSPARQNTWPDRAKRSGVYD